MGTQFSNDDRHIVFMEWSSGDPSWLAVAPSDGTKPAIRVSDIYPDPIGTHYQWSPNRARSRSSPTWVLACS